MTARLLIDTNGDTHGDTHRDIHRRIHRFGIAGLALVVVGAMAGCPMPTPRPAGSDGTSRWAFGIAQPVIAAFAADAQVRTILGNTVGLDGRLPSNTGAWSFVAWSPTRSTIQVTVNANGTTSSSQRTDAAPGPGIQVPLTAAWADSPQVLAATSGKRAAGATVANLIVLNVASYASAPNTAVWGINFDAGPNQLVAATGGYIGPE
jgi:hypothetical protein